MLSRHDTQYNTQFPQHYTAPYIMSHTLVGIQCVIEPLLRNLSVVSSLEFYEVIIYRQTIFLQSLTCQLYENKLVPNSLQDLKINKAVALPVGQFSTTMVC